MIATTELLSHEVHEANVDTSSLWNHPTDGFEH